jgi:hypothetical protein
VLTSIDVYLAQRINSIKQSPSSEAKSLSAIQEILCLLWKPKVDFRVHNSLPLVPILSQFNPVHTLQPYFLMINSNIIFPPTTTSSGWSLPFRFSDQNFYAFLISFMLATCPPTSSFFHPLLLDQPYNIFSKRNKL